MGWNLLRRKTLRALAAALILAGVLGPAWAEVAPTAAVPDILAVPQDADGRQDAAGWQDADGPLPPAQGHLGVELYSLSIPDEDVIGRFADRLLLTRRNWLQAVLDRSLEYREVIVGAIGDRMMPPELRFLPAVESGYQARALSPKGAAGLWQLMRNTASPYGLRMDQWVDERRDFWKATEASLAKLTENFALFGDWYLALAAYNCGVGKLTAILRKNPGCDYWALRRKGVLPRETASFVPQFLALARILGYPGRNGLEITWDPPPEWTRIPVDRCVDLRILSRESGVPLNALTAGNQELNFPMTPPASYGYQLKIRAEHSGAVEKTLAGATLPLLEFRVHVVAEGDTLLAMARRYGVSVALIQEFNPKLAPRALRIGSRVLVPITPARSSG